VIVLMAIVFTLPWAGPLTAADDGGYAGAFLRLDISARAAGMGGTFTAIADGPTGFHYNPAGPAWVSEPVVGAAYRKMGFDRRHGSIAVLWPLRKEAAIVGSWVHAGVDNVFERDYEGEIGDEIGESNNAISFTFAKKFTSFLSLGVNLRYVQMNIANINAYTVGFDFGAMFNLPRSALAVGGPKGLTDFRLGLVLERINYKFPWNTYDYWVKSGESGQSFEERWPINFRGGIAASVYDRRATLAIDIEVNEEAGSLFHGGIEVLPIPALALRGGINGEHFTAGVGIEVALGQNNLVVDYAFASTDDIIDDEHLFSLGVRF